MTPRLTIIIVTYNSTADIDRCLGSLAQHPPVVSHQTIVVDNASPDGTAAAVRARWPQITVIDAGGNVGFAAANNIALRRSAGELVLLLNPDTIVPEGSIDALVRTIDSDPRIAIAGPRLVDADGRSELSFGSMMSPLAEFRQKILVRGHARHLPIVSSRVERLVATGRDVDWVSGACLLVRRDAAEAAGLMDERYFMYAEDVDFCAAVRAGGRRVRFVPEAVVVHARGRSAGADPARVRQASRRSQLAFYAKHHPRWVTPLRLYLKLIGELPDTLESTKEREDTVSPRRHEGTETHGDS